MFRVAVARVLAPDGVPRSTARDASLTLAAKPARSLVTIKQLMRGLDVLQPHVAEETRVFLELMRGAEAREAFAAFVERRLPDFSTIRDQG